MFVLGIDPGLSVTGYGVVEASSSGVRPVAVGTIRTGADLPVAERLLELHRDITAVIAEHPPGEVAIEQVFVNQNLQTATAVGRASGVIVLAAAEAGIAVHEYTPSAVKMAVTGDGRAAKRQIEAMVSRRLGIEPGAAAADAYDALAVALCHVQSAGVRRLAVGGSQ
jgi:crossover junction endodeoxyribonuclease RuvC